MQNVIIELYDSNGTLLLPCTRVPIEITPTHLSELINKQVSFFLNGQPINSSLLKTLEHQKIKEYESVIKITTSSKEDPIGGDFCTDSFSGHEAAILTIHTLNNLLITGGGDSTVRLWCKLTKTQKKIIKGHNGVVYGIDSNKQVFVTCGSDGVINIYNHSGDILKKIVCSKKGVTLVKLIELQNENLIICGSRDNYFRVYNFDGNCLFNFSHLKPITCIDSTKNYLISGSRDGTVKIFNFFNFFKEFNFASAVNCNITFKDYLIVGCENGFIHIYKEFELIKILQHSLGVLSISVSPNNYFFATSSLDKSIKIFSLENFKKIGQYLHTDSVYKVFCFNDRIVSCSKDKSVLIYDLGNKVVVSRVVCGDEVYDFGICDNKIVCGGKDRKLYFLG